MKIGGFQKTSLIEFPGKLSCVVFVQGCNLRCPYCHNPELVLPEKFSPSLDPVAVTAFLERRKQYLEGVVITGGEPCLDIEGLLSFAKGVKAMGYLVKLDTNGTFPEVIRKVIEGGLADYIAMDIKGPPEKYEKFTGAKVDVEEVKKSIALIKNSGLGHEFRTTVAKELLAAEDFEGIGRMLKGAGLYYLQRFMPSKTVDPGALSFHSYSDEEFEKIRKDMLRYVKECSIR